MAKSRENKFQRKILEAQREKEMAMAMAMARWETTNILLAFPKIFRKVFEYSMYRAINKPIYNYVLRGFLWFFNVDTRTIYYPDGRKKNVGIFKNGELFMIFKHIETAIVTDLKKFQEENANEQKEKR